MTPSTLTLNQAHDLLSDLWLSYEGKTDEDSQEMQYMIGRALEHLEDASDVLRKVTR